MEKIIKIYGITKLLLKRNQKNILLYIGHNLIKNLSNF